MNNQQMTQIAMQMLSKKPQIANSPMGRQFMQILRSGDADPEMRKTLKKEVNEVIEDLNHMT